MDHYKIWEVISYAWTEIGLEDEDYPKYAAELKSEYGDWEVISRIIYKDVCGSFALDSFLIFPCMLWMIMPDWCYDEKYLQERAHNWYQKPYWLHFINPLRILGYPVALALSSSVKNKLKNAYKNT